MPCSSSIGNSKGYGRDDSPWAHEDELSLGFELQILAGSGVPHDLHSIAAGGRAANRSLVNRGPHGGGRGRFEHGGSPELP